MVLKALASASLGLANFRVIFNRLAAGDLVSDLNVLFLALGLSLSLHLVKSLDLHSPASLILSPMCLPVYILYSVRQNLYMTNKI